MRELSERFWAKVDKSPGFGPNGDCWRWAACLVRGYGQFKILGREEYAHRVAFELTVGPIPAGLHVLHSCDERRCVNPAHLRSGTNDDNVLDRVQKGRGAKVLVYTEPKRNSTSGVLGVCSHTAGGRWVARFKIPGGRRLERRFKSFDEAVAQRRAWEVEFLGQ